MATTLTTTSSFVSPACPLFLRKLTVVVVPAGRKSKSKPSASGSFASELQAQWEQDRSKKGDYKRARALARAEAEETSPHLHKKGSRPPPASAGSSDVVTINYQIREFLLHDIGQKTLALPPMSKKSRVAVHLLCEVYGLKSKSHGKGKARYPVLERTSKTGTYRVDERRIGAIIGTAAGERSGGGYGGGKAKGKMGGLWSALSGEKGSSGRTQGKQNRDGGVVGEGAASLGEGNIGFALLKKMGCVLSLSLNGVHELTLVQMDGGLADWRLGRYLDPHRGSHQDGTCLRSFVPESGAYFSFVRRARVAWEASHPGLELDVCSTLSLLESSVKTRRSCTQRVLALSQSKVSRTADTGTGGLQQLAGEFCERESAQTLTSLASKDS